MKPVFPQSPYKTLNSCGGDLCTKCALCREVNFEERRKDRWKQRDLWVLNELYQSIYLQHLQLHVVHLK